MGLQIIAVTNVVQCGVPNEINDRLSLSFLRLGLLVQSNFSVGEKINKIAFSTHKPS